MYAVDRNHKDITRILLDRGIEVNKYNQLGYTALHYAAHKGHTDLAQLLLENEANIEIPANEGETCLMYAKK